MKSLNTSTLHLLPGRVQRPVRDRSQQKVGIVHLGIGAFHRAHQAAFTEDCLDAGAHGWAITAASLRHSDTRDALAPQDGLYTLALRQGDQEKLRVIGAISKILVAPQEPAAVLGAMIDPDVRIVSLTVTEKGYSANVASGDLRLDDADVQHDLAHPDAPRTALGFVARALDLRRAARIAPFTLLSCDNLPGNGRLLHRVLTQFADARDAAFGRYVADMVASPSCMVDRIVPATTAADRASISQSLGLRDAWPVMAEPFYQWVIEDDFRLGRPEWERCGVEFTKDVADHEAMKLRLLNGAHSSIAAIGRLSGHDTVAGAMANPVIRAFIARYWAEVAPTIARHIDVPAYTGRLLDRFDNTALHHKTAQIATDASLKVPQRIVAPLRELRAAGRPGGLLVFALAAWIRSCLGFDDKGREMPMSDPQMQTWAGRPGPDLPSAQIAQAFVRFAPVFGPKDDLALAADIASALQDIRQHGILAAAQMRIADKS